MDIRDAPCPACLAHGGLSWTERTTFSTGRIGREFTATAVRHPVLVCGHCDLFIEGIYHEHAMTFLIEGGESYGDLIEQAKAAASSERVRVPEPEEVPYPRSQPCA